jgi:hypothetical protein
VDALTSHVATPKAVVGHGQVEDQALTVRCVLEVVADLHVAAPLACACHYAVLSGTVCPAVRNNGPRDPTIQSCALVAPEWAVQVLVWSP